MINIKSTVTEVQWHKKATHHSKVKKKKLYTLLCKKEKTLLKVVFNDFDFYNLFCLWLNK